MILQLKKKDLKLKKKKALKLKNNFKTEKKNRN